LLSATRRRRACVRACVRMVGAVKYLLWANLILNLVNILPTLIISILLNMTR
jgi:hypothetical protein